MISSRLGLAVSLAVAAATLGGCVDDGYGYGGVAVGYGPGSYYGDGYGDGYVGDGYGGYGYGGYGYAGYGYGYPGYGWYGGFYYPGTGFYVFDRGGGRHRWDDRQRAYWEAHRRGAPGDGSRRPDAGYAGAPGQRGEGFDRGAWRGRPNQRGFASGDAARAPGQVPQSISPGREAYRQQGQRGFRGAPAGAAAAQSPRGARTPGASPYRGDGGRREPKRQ